MPKKFKRSPDPEVGGVPTYEGLSPNQVVAYNLSRAREWKGWTQDQAAEALSPYLGTRWSKASFSQAERSIAGRFVRNFDADEIVAFARAFELPVTWFFLPPPPWSEEPGVPVRLATPDAEEHGQALGLLVDLVFGEPVQQGLLALRLEAFLNQLGPPSSSPRPSSASPRQSTPGWRRWCATRSATWAGGKRSALHRQPAGGPGAAGQGWGCRRGRRGAGGR
jgi:hypothetical protein